MLLAGLKRRRGTVQTEMDSDSSELAAIDKECAALQVIRSLARSPNDLSSPLLTAFFCWQAKLDRIQSNSKTLQSEADLIEKQVTCNYLRVHI
jgi:hypothetical protein